MTLSYAENARDNQTYSHRVAWLFPSLERGNYWHPLFSKLAQSYPETIIYTGIWTGFAAGFDGQFTVEVVGKTKLFHTTQTKTGYSRSYIFPSFEIIPKLLSFRPEIIFTSAFSLWTAIALVLKFFLGWRVIVIFDGVSPGVDHLNSGVRVIPRRIMCRLIDSFITNSQAGKQYLTHVAWAEPSKIFVQPYLVPDVAALGMLQAKQLDVDPAPKPIFLYVGQVIPRKGIKFLLQACAQLKRQGYNHFTLLIVGDGDQRSELEAFSLEQGLTDCVQWIGAVEYHHLGEYFNRSDIFIFPTLEDIWGVVVSEAMAFGKPVLCSKWAGATDVISEGHNGFIFDPYDPSYLSGLMQDFIDQPQLIDEMGAYSKQLSADLTPQSAADFFSEIIAKPKV